MRGCRHGLNRTFVELKHFWLLAVIIEQGSLNRTFVELKQEVDGTSSVWNTMS